MEIINLKIDVTKITKSRLYKGEKGTYLNCALIPTPNSEHSDYMITEDVSKEERESGVKGVILGNAKIFKKKESAPSSKVPAEGISKDEDLPF